MKFAEASEERASASGDRSTVRLQYPLGEWVEGLLKKYPNELASIRPEASAKHGMRRGKRRKV